MKQMVHPALKKPPKKFPKLLWPSDSNTAIKTFKNAVEPPQAFTEHPVRQEHQRFIPGKGAK